MYTYHCECLPATHSPYYDDLLHRLKHEQEEAIVGEEDVSAILRLMPKSKEACLVLSPVQNGFYSVRVAYDTVSHQK
jgi:hypothetical protein